MIHFLGSVRLTSGILIAIAILSVWGTLAPHRDVYRHPLYLAVLALFGLNITVCLIRRTVHQWRQPSLRLGGYVFSHAGMLLILIGSLVSLIFGVRTVIWLGAGESVDRIQTRTGFFEHLGFELVLKVFKLDLHSTGLPSEYISDVLIRQPDRPDRAASIMVNHPLSLDGYSVFQSGYQLETEQSIVLTITEVAREPRLVSLTIPGEPVILSFGECDELRIRGLRYEPDFVMAGTGRIGSRSILPVNPAIQLDMQCGEDQQIRQWLFMHHDTAHQAGLWDSIQIQFTSVDQQYQSGLEIVRDPGTGWVSAGAISLIIGLLFYIFPFILAGDRR